MHRLLAARDTRLLLLGNEAIVRGALEAGVGFVTTYPGTPGSEIGDTFHRLHDEAGVGFEYSINEKVALEVAGAVAATGVRALVAMKHVGVNVAADPLMTLAYIGVRGGLVLVTADDPGCHSSQNEQDNRHFARLSKLPMLEPATPEEAFHLVQEAFALSERHQAPVLLRTTTRVSHTRAAVAVGAIRPPVRYGAFTPDKRRFTPVPAVARLRHPVVEATLRNVEAEFETSPHNRMVGFGRLGILASGVAAVYVSDIVHRLGVADRVCVLTLGTTHPVPRRLLMDFVGRVDRALVVEELDPILEGELRQACVRAGRLIEIFGKESGHFSLLGELGPDQVAAALADLLGIALDGETLAAPEGLPPRPPILCPGCPHRATYYAVKLAMGDDAMYLSDIGCYTLGFLPPIGMGDYFICMGSSASSSGGFAATTDKPVVAFIGDSTFFHSGLTGLINSVHHRRDMLLVVLDNGTTGMTGHQPHPATPLEPYQAVDLEGLARAAGVAHVATIDPTDYKNSVAAIQRLREQTGPKVLISRSPCPLFERKSQGRKRAGKYRIDADKCMFCGREHAGLRCDLTPHRDYGLARGRARVLGAAPNEETAPRKMTTPPCEAACPLGLCVQGYVEQIAAGRLDAARALIRQRLVLPHTVCRVCDHPCEAVCVRGDRDEPIAINRLKRFAMDSETDEDRVRYVESIRAIIRDNGRRVAVVGGGPAGLACAFDLRLRGYDVHVFEAAAEAGGLCAQVIPAYRLPREALERDLAVIWDVGVVFHFGRRLGENLSLAQLRAEGFAAAYLATGLPGGARLGVEGDELPGVIDAMALLRAAAEGDATLPAGPVVVVGGGNSAIDAARTARRLGANEVTILYRRTRREMPAIAAEIDDAVAEGVTLVELAAPARVSPAAGGLTVVCQRMRLGAPDASGRPRPEPSGEIFEIACGAVIAAVGQLAGEVVADPGGVAVDRWGRVAADPATGATSDPFVFAGGDVATGPASVARALAAGKYAAYGIDRALADDPARVVREAWRDRDALLAEPRYVAEAVPAAVRRTAPRVAAADAVAGFAEIEGAYDREAAMAEAARCLACGMCAACHNCLDNFGCPAFYLDGGRVSINPILCDGCGACVQVCPNGAIVPVAAEGGLS